MILVLGYELIGVSEEIFFDHAVFLSLQSLHGIEVRYNLEWTVLWHPDLLLLFLQFDERVHFVFVIVAVIGLD